MSQEPDRISYLTDALLFPPVENASSEGLLAVGGDLTPERLTLAYKSGIFPWFNDDSLILWWSPDPRMVLFPEKLKVSKSMRKVLREGRFHVTRNKAFNEVVSECSAIERPGQEGTWITAAMKDAYAELHRRGIAHSYEVWEGEELVGGLYGIELEHIFCGESMFARKSNASKVGFVTFVQDMQEKGCKLIDCQVYTSHLESLGAVEIPRKEYMEYLRR